MSDCIDVESRYPRHKLGYEDPAFESTQDPWHKVILCRDGHISPAGGNKLWACTSGNRKKASTKLREGGDKMPPYTITMDGSDGINVEFDAADAAFFFKLMGAIVR